MEGALDTTTSRRAQKSAEANRSQNPRVAHELKFEKMAMFKARSGLPRSENRHTMPASKHVIDSHRLALIAKPRRAPE